MLAAHERSLIQARPLPAPPHLTSPASPASPTSPHLVHTFRSQLYCDTLNPLIERKGHAPLTFDAAWFQYRLHIVWAIAAFVISAGVNRGVSRRCV